MSIQEQINAIIESKGKAEIFAKWAWGENFRNIQLPSSKAVDLWNSRHGEHLILHPSGNVWEDLNEMVNLWEKLNPDT